MGKLIQKAKLKRKNGKRISWSYQYTDPKDEKKNKARRPARAEYREKLKNSDDPIVREKAVKQKKLTDFKRSRKFVAGSVAKPKGGAAWDTITVKSRSGNVVYGTDGKLYTVKKSKMGEYVERANKRYYA